MKRENLRERERSRRFGALWAWARFLTVVMPFAVGATREGVRSDIRETGKFIRVQIHEWHKDNVECRLLKSDPDHIDPKDIKQAAEWMGETGLYGDRCTEIKTRLTDTSNALVQRRLINLALERLESPDKWQPAWGEFIDAAITQRTLTPAQINKYIRQGITLKQSAVFRPSTAPNLLVVEVTFDPVRLGPKTAEAIAKCPYKVNARSKGGEAYVLGHYSVGLMYGVIFHSPPGAAPPSEHGYNIDFTCFPRFDPIYDDHDAEWHASLSVSGASSTNKISNLGNEIVHFLTSLTFEPALGQCYLLSRYFEHAYPFTLRADLSGLGHLYTYVSYGAMDNPLAHRYGAHLATVENAADYVSGGWRLTGYVPGSMNGATGSTTLTLSSENPFAVGVLFGDKQRASKFGGWAGSFTVNSELQPCPSSGSSR